MSEAFTFACTAGRPFLKMHGLRNDFIVVDACTQPYRPAPATIRALCERHAGIGADQLLVLEPPTAPAATAWMRIYNIDGTEAPTCLNATRCVAWLLMRERGTDAVCVETLGGLVEARDAGPWRVSLTLPPPRWAWADIPLAHAADTVALPIVSGPLREPVAISLGNPHLVCFVASRDAIDVPRWAPALQHHPLLLLGANVGVAEMVTPERLRLVVWERPGLLTQACGSGACAAVVAAHRRGLTRARRMTVEMPAGALEVDWREDDRLVLTGAVALAFTGHLPPAEGVAA